MMQIELKVDCHPSGRLTLKRRDQGDRNFKDYPAGGPLFGNTDKGKFYRAVAQELANLSNKGHDVQYGDVQSMDDFGDKVKAEFAIDKPVK